MPAKRIATVLGTSDEFRKFARAARRLAELQQVFLDSAPAELAHASRVKHSRAGTLFLWADNAAVATKLRQLAPRLLTAFQKQVAEIKAVQVEVQVSDAPQARHAGAGKTTLSIDIIDKFMDLAGRTHDPELKSALTNFARRHSGKPR